METLLYLLVLLALWGAELLAGREHWRRKWQHTRINLMFASSALPIQLLLTVWLLAAARLVTEQQWGLVYLLPFSGNALLRTAALFVMLDACEYAYHRLMHAVPVLWRFHLAHHSDRDLDVSTTLREHPGESLFRNSMMIVWVLLCGASVEVLILRQAVMTVANLTSHSRFRLPHALAQRVQWLIVTPNFHRVHHHHELPHTNCNYGDVFTVWDRLFGTASSLRAEEVRCGVDTHWTRAQTDNYVGVLMMPFRSVPAPALDQARSSTPSVAD